MNILCVDDDKNILHALERIFKKTGYSIITAASAQEALSLLSKNSISVIITDYYMPGMNGEAFCRKVRDTRKYNDIPVLFLSGSVDKADVSKMFDAGATDYVVKPFAQEELLARVNVHTRNRQLTDDLKQKIEELVDLNKMKDDFLAIASHDLRSPITGILSWSDLLLEANDLSEDDRECLKHIKSATRHLLDLINDLLELSRVQSQNSELKRSPLLPVLTVKACIATLKHMALPKKITLDYVSDNEGSQKMYGDENALMRVLTNLLSNAIKFTPVGGTVTVAIHDKKDSIGIEVNDTGIGIPEQQLPYLFDQYTRNSRRGTAGERGTGLGLSITKQLIEKMGGSIEVASQEGRGTTFTMSFQKVV